jgi:DNA-binding response OmpR family regulator
VNLSFFQKRDSNNNKILGLAQVGRCIMPDDIRILYVDDEPSLLELGKFFLERSGRFSVDTITSALAALSLQNTRSYDAIISDYQMPEMDGIEFLKKIRSSGNTIPFILFTGRRREEVVIQALDEGADFYLQKGGEPASLFAELSHKIRYAVMRRHTEDSLKQKEARLRQILNRVPHRILVKDGRPVHSS